MKKLLLAFFVVCVTVFVNAQSQMRVKGVVTQEEKDFLLELKKKYPEIPLTNNVVRYYTIDEFGNKENVKVELIYDEIQYQDQFQYYSAYILDNKVFSYEGSSGLVYTEYGTITYAGEQLVKTSYGYGTTNGSTNIFVDGKKIYEKEFELDK